MAGAGGAFLEKADLILYSTYTPPYMPKIPSTSCQSSLKIARTLLSGQGRVAGSGAWPAGRVGRGQ